MSGSDDRKIKVWAMRPVDESEWEEVQGEGTAEEGPKDWRGKYVLKLPYWRNTVTGDLEQQKPSKSENLRLEPRDDQSLGCAVSPSASPQLPFLTSPLLNTTDAESLAMITEKQNAHNNVVSSVQFSPNGALIVSGSWDRTIKVWGALAAPDCQPQLPFPLVTTLVLNIAGAESLTMIAEKQNAHSRDITSVGYNHDGTKVVSACEGGTIKVWDSGAFWASNRPSLTKTDACWLAWQLRWISRQRKRTRIATMSVLCSSRPMEAKSCPDPGTRRSKFGIQVRLRPQNAFPWPKLTLGGLPGSYAGSQD